MLYTIIKENTYQDSIVLMLLSNKLSGIDGVNKASVMMGTPANKDIFKSSGLATDEMSAADANDIIIVVDTDDEAKVKEAEAEVDAALKGEGKEETEKTSEASNWKRALELANKPNLALISIPGQYAAMEAETALRNDLNVFMFSDNVSIEDEVRLKQLAHDKGLLVMGPDCGTGIIHGVPLAFTNTVKEGNIGIVGASGTGIQEVATIIDRLGGGVTNAIGTGGRDLSEQVGAITMIDSIKALNMDPKVEVITVISKPPAKEVKDKVENVLRNIDKPVVTLFLGAKPEYNEENIYHAYTLEETAVVSLQLSKGETPNFEPTVLKDLGLSFNEGQIGIKGYYSGGTLASEAAMLLHEAFKDEVSADKKDGYMFKSDHHEVIDLGDDKYTQGKPHPMIDPDKRIEMLETSANDPETAVIMLDNVIGYGSHDDMASELAPAIEQNLRKAKEAGRDLAVLATVIGTEQDHQGYQKQIDTLKAAGAIICRTNDEMVRTAIDLVGGSLEPVTRETKQFDKTEVDLTIDEKIMNLINTKPSIINIGLKSFTKALQDHEADFVQFNWRPVAGGDEKLMKVLQFLNNFEGETI